MQMMAAAVCMLNLLLRAESNEKPVRRRCHRLALEGSGLAGLRLEGSNCAGPFARRPGAAMLGPRWMIFGPLKEGLNQQLACWGTLAAGSTGRLP